MEGERERESERTRECLYNNFTFSSCYVRLRQNLEKGRALSSQLPLLPAQLVLPSRLMPTIVGVACVWLPSTHAAMAGLSWETLMSDFTAGNSLSS